MDCAGCEFIFGMRHIIELSANNLGGSLIHLDNISMESLERVYLGNTRGHETIIANIPSLKEIFISEYLAWTREHGYMPVDTVIDNSFQRGVMGMRIRKKVSCVCIEE